MTDTTKLQVACIMLLNGTDAQKLEAFAFLSGTPTVAELLKPLLLQKAALLSAIRKAIVCVAHDSKEAKEECYTILNDVLQLHGD